METDLLLALASKGDRHHRKAVDLIRENKLKLSPYSLLELDLIIGSKGIDVDVSRFYRSLDSLLEYYGVMVLTPSPKHFRLAWELRERYELTYFDSLHASTAISEGLPLVSFNKVYAKVRELRYVNPRELG